MKRIALIAIISFCHISLFAQQAFYDVSAADGNGIRFWQSDFFKIHMGNSGEYHYGPVTDYSIKMNMSSDTGRGWTWGLQGSAPVAGLSNIGNMQIAGNFIAGGIIGINGTPVINTNNNANDIYINGRVIRNESTGITDGMYINYNSNGSTNAHLRFYANGAAERMRIDATTGNVGIGTTSPGAPLSVVGAKTSDQTVVNVTNQSDQDFQIRLSGIGASVKRTIIGPSTSNRFSLGVGTGAEHLTIINTGNVGIGTTSPDQLLTVNGTIHSKEVKVDLSVPAPDYVFEKDYDLNTLDSVKAYIDRHKHLPEVPSAKEMEENGVSLGEMNMLLLKKMEEMTLYMIELKSENEAIKVQMNKMNMEINK